MQPALSDQEFFQFQRMIYDIAGISLSEGKKPLVSGRLAKRLKHHGVERYGDYFRLISERENAAELQTAVDLLTTNETYFFREPKHFDFLRQKIIPERAQGGTFRIWSGACSFGEEPYTMAMALADSLGERPWEVFASDLSTRVLDRARRGHYPIERAESIPKPPAAILPEGRRQSAGHLSCREALARTHPLRAGQPDSAAAQESR